MIQFINDTDIFVLLGLESLTEEEKEKYTEDMTQIIWNYSINRLEKDETIIGERKAKLILNLAKEKEEGILMDNLFDEYPEINNFMDEETYVYKKGAVMDVLKSTLDELKKKHDATLIELIDTIENLIMITQRDDLNSEGVFKELWEKYADLKSKSNVE